MRVPSLWLVVALSASGCFAPLVTVDGRQLREDKWKTDLSLVRSRAPFDMGCDAEKVTITALDNFGGSMDWVSQVGVRGCGKTAVYVRPNLQSPLQLNSVRAD